MEELAEHHQDLQEAVRAEGCAEAEAETRASQLLGEPVELAGRFAAALRQSSWFGRHRVITFCLLPPVGIFAASVLGLVLALVVLRWFYSAEEWQVLAGEGDGWNAIALGVRTSWYLAMASMTLLFCWVARRSAAGIRWALATCAVCALQSLFGFCRIVPHSTTIGYTIAPNWICALIPLAIGGVVYALHRRARAPIAMLPQLDQDS